MYKRKIIHGFGLPQTITADQGTPFTKDKVLEVAYEYGFSIINSTPYYAQANCQVE